MKRLLIGAVASATLALSAGTASAAVSLLSSNTNVNGYTSIAGLNLLTDFDSSTNLVANFLTMTSEAAILTGTPLTGGVLQPLNDSTAYLTVPNANSSAFPIGTNPYEATMNLPGLAATTIGFYWGSPDTYNEVELFSGATSRGTYNGTQFLSSLALSPSGGNQNSRYVQLWAGGLTFDTVVFRSTDQAFELDNVATSVPEPGEWAMMLAGLGVVSLIARRRRATN